MKPFVFFLLVFLRFTPGLRAANVAFVGRDTTTQGRWRSFSPADPASCDIDKDGRYGSHGHLIFNCSTNTATSGWGWAAIADPLNTSDAVFNGVAHTTVRTGLPFLLLDKAEISNCNVEPWGRVTVDDPRTGGQMHAHWAAVDGKRYGNALKFTFTRGHAGTLRFGFILPGTGAARVRTIEIRDAGGKALASCTTTTDGGEADYYFFDFVAITANTSYTLYLARPQVSGDENNVKILGFTVDKKASGTLFLLR